MMMEEKLLQWYCEHKRQLPWRESKNEYDIYVSEIMLQQTRVETVIPYFISFIRQFPDFQALAGADDEKLLKAWEGLGYYSRVKNMKKCAQQVTLFHQGCFPQSFEEMKKLPGIGDYSAGSILSIAHDLPFAAVDGNVLRIYARLFEIKEDIQNQSLKKKIKERIEATIPKNSGDFNQALMDLGATICLTRNPLCDSCPIQSYCLAFAHQKTAEYPVKKKKMAKSEKNMIVLIIQTKEKQFILRKRKKNGLLANLFEPLCQEGISFSAYVDQLQLDTIEKITFLGRHDHIFTHLIWHMEAYHVQVLSYPLQEGEFFAKAEEIQKKYAIPNAFSFFFDQLI